MPVFNERRTIAEALRRVWQSPMEKEVIVVDDASTDGTAEWLKKHCSSTGPTELILCKTNCGKGAAIRRALKEANGDIVIIQDGDLEYDPKEYGKLVELILEGSGDIVYGSRMLVSNPISHWRYYIGGRMVTSWANLLYNSKLTDLPTCYKAFRRSLLRSIPLRENGFGFCAEVTAHILRSGRQIIEVPISYCPRTLADGKKIRWKDGLRQLWVLLKLRFSKTESSPNGESL